MKNFSLLSAFLLCCTAVFSQNEPFKKIFPPKSGIVPDTQKIHDAAVLDTPSLTPATTNPLARCDNPTTIQCNKKYRNQTTVGYPSNFNWTDYNCANAPGYWNGRDRIYKIELTQKTDLYIRVDSFPSSTDFDIFLLDNCLTPNCIAIGGEDNAGTGIAMESIWRNDLNPGVYYLIVDGFYTSDVGNFNLEVLCDCPCTEPNNDVSGRLVLGERFDLYSPGGIDAQSNRWAKWPFNPSSLQLEGLVADQGGNKVLKMEYSASAEPDVWYDFENRQEGRFRLSFNMMVEIGKGGRFLVQHTQPTTTSNGNQAYEVQFNPDGSGSVTPGNANAAPWFFFKYPQGVWNRITQIIDLDGNWVELWINGIFIAQWDFNIGSAGLNGFLRGLNFDAHTANYSYYVDNICLWQQNQSTCGLIYQPVCIESGGLEGNPCFAHIALYTDDEIEPCQSVCDYGGTLIYRSDKFTGELDASDVAPWAVRTDSCVVAAFGGGDIAQVPSPLYADIYVFYDDDGAGVIPSFSSPNGAELFVYACNWDYKSGFDKDSSGSLIALPSGEHFFNPKYFGCALPKFGQKCLSGNILSCDRFYYLVVVGTLGKTYELTVFPNGPCNVQPAVLNCGQPITGLLSPLNSKLNYPAHYSDCYNGAESYSGGENFFKIVIEKPQKIRLTLSSPGKTGIFLFSSLCGRNCVGYAENTAASNQAVLEVPLTEGVYYIVVDRTAIGLTLYNFSLSMDCVPDAIFPSIKFFRTSGSGTTICPNDNSPANRHQVGIRQTAFEMAQDDQLVFVYYDFDGQIHSNQNLNQFWHGLAQPMTMNLPRDIAGDPDKCAYETGDSLKMFLVQTEDGHRLYTPMSLKFGPLGTGVTAQATFQPGGLSDLRQMIPEPRVLFGSETSILRAQDTAEYRKIIFGSSKNWQSEFIPPVSWVHMDPDSGGAPGYFERILHFDENLLPTSRSTILRFYAVDEPDVYQQFVTIVQMGKCVNPSVTIVPNKTAVCPGESVTLTATHNPAENGLYTYLWNTGDTSKTIVKIPPGGGGFSTTYSVTITNRDCFKIASDVQQITVLLPPNPPQNPVNQSVCAGATGLPQPLAVSGGGNTVNWYNQPVGGNLLRQNSTTFAPASIPPTTTTYYAESVNTAGCRSTTRTPVTLTINPLPVLTLQDTVCQPNLQFYDVTVTVSGATTITATAGTVTGGPGVFIILNISKSIPSVVVTATNTTTTCQKTLTIISPKCACPAMPAPAPAGGGDQSYCAGQPKPSLKVSVGPGETADWFDSPVGQTPLSPPGGTTEFFPTNPGDFWVRRRNLLTGCVSAQRLKISLIENPSPSLVKAADPQCTNDRMTYSVLLNASPGCTVSVPPPATVASQSGSSWLVSGVPVSQNLTATAVFQNTNCSTTLMVEAPVCPCPPDIPAPQSLGDKSYCPGEAIPAVSVSVNFGESVLWYSTPSGGLPLQNGTELTYQPNGPGDFYAERVVYGCPSALRTKVSVLKKPLPVLSIDSIYCEGTGQGGWQRYSVLLFSNTTNIVVTGTFTIVPNTGGAYTVVGIPLGQQVIITATLDGCPVQQSVNFTQGECQCPMLAAPVSCGDVEMCQNQGSPVPEICVEPSGYSVSWYPEPSGGAPFSNGSDTDKFTPPGPGDYWAQAKIQGTSCISTSRTKISVKTVAPTQVDAIVADATICSDEKASISSVVNGPGVNTATWSASVAGGVFLPNNGTGATSYTPPAGVSTIILTLTSNDTVGPCPTGSDQVILTVNPTPILILLDTVCQPNLQFYDAVVSVGGATTIAATSGTVTGGPGVFTIRDIPENEPGIIVTATNATTTCQKTLTIISPQCDCPLILPPAPAGGGDQSYCAGQPKPSLKVSVGPGETADWFDSPVGQTPLSPPGGTTEFFPTSPAKFWVRRRNLISGCVSAQRLEISLIENPTPSLAQAADPQCAPDRLTYSVSLNASPGSSVSVPPPATVVSQGGLSWFVTGVPASQDLTATAVFQNTNCSAALTVKAPICECPPNIPAPQSQGDKSYCPGAAVPSLLVSVNSGESVLWYSDASGGTALQNGSQPTYQPNGPGCFYAERVVNGCPSASRTKVCVIEKPLPALSIDSIYCEGTGQGGWQRYSVLFFSNTTNIVVTGTFTIVPNTGGAYTVVGIPLGQQITITATLDGCPVQQSVNFTQSECQCPTVAAPVSCGDVEMCLSAGSPVPEICVKPSGNSVSWYQFQSGGTPFFNGVNTDKFTPPGTGDYWAQAQIQGTFCTSTSRTKVSVKGIEPPLVDAIVADPTICSDEKASLSGVVSGPGVNSATWSASVAGGVFLPNNGAGATSYTPPADVPTITLTLTSNDPVGPCPAGSDQMVLIVNSTPTYKTDTVACAADLDTYSVLFSSNADDVSSSSPGSALETLPNNQFLLKNLMPGKNASIVLRFSQTGCDREITVSAPACQCPFIAPPVSPGDKVICPSDGDKTLTVNVPNGFEVRWYDAAGQQVGTGKTYTPPKAGTYYAEAIDPLNDCTSIKTEVKLTFLPEPIAFAADQSVCPDQSATLTALDGPGYQFLWSNGQSGSSITVPGQAATYVLTVWLGQCMKKDTVSVTLKPAVNAAIVPIVQIPCFGDAKGALRANVFGGTNPSWTWSNGSNAAEINFLLAGTYTLSAKNEEGCNDVATYVLTEPPAIDVANAVIQNATNTQSNDGSISVTPKGGTPPYHFQWYTGTGSIINGDTASQIVNKPAGEYRIRITDANGCVFLSEIFTIKTTVSAIGQTEWQQAVQVYPNPTDGLVWLQCIFPAPAEVETSVFDVLGRQLMLEKHGQLQEKKLSLDFSPMPDGAYLIQVKVGEHVVTKRLVVQKW